ncbi:hypothetical protein Tco_0393747 [Tanacetum coccineum]
MGVMGGIVNEVQSAFIADRHILDGPFILNEMLSWCNLKEKKSKSLIFKVDFEKAYDSVGILRSLESIRSKFFNGIDGSRTTGFHGCNGVWPFLSLFSDNGGLGISSLFALNRGLIFKWVWRFVSQENSLWARVIKAVHGKDGSIGVNVKNVSNSVWLNIIREINVLSEKGINLMNQLRIKLGNGEMTHFWDDNWCEGGRLKDRFPRIYALEECKDITDRWTWTLNSSGDFSVASVRSYIDTTMLPKGDYQTRWVNLVPIKVRRLLGKVTDIQEKDKNRSQNDKIEHENGKTVRSQKDKVKVNKSQKVKVNPRMRHWEEHRKQLILIA